MFKREDEGGEMVPMQEPVMADEMETIIGPSVKVEGNFTSNGNVVIEGALTGTIKTNRDLRVGEGAVIEADVHAENISSAGTITGAVFCNQKLDLKQTGKIFGDVEAGIMSVETGAILQGKCTSGAMMQDQTEPAPQPELEEPQPAPTKNRRGKAQAKSGA
jgi:cytoskeletal protein CcmA (bactofilin family)